MARKVITIDDLKSQTFKSKHYGEFIVLNEEPRTETSPYIRRVKIRFLNTGNEITTQLCNVFSGNVRDSGNPDPSTPRIYQIQPVDFDKIYDTIYNGQFKIIHDYGYNYPDRKDRMVRIKFIDTGYETDISLKNVADGYIRDKLKSERISLNNDVYLDFEDKLLYTRWNLMISRCYNSNDKNYRNYGALGVKVCDRWNNFTNYKNDIKNIYGYDLFIVNPDMYHLDKDYLQLILPMYMRVYSPETCIWLNKYSNCTILINKTSTIFNGVVYDNMGFYALLFNANDCSLVQYGPFADVYSAARFFNSKPQHASIALKLPICQSPGEGDIKFKYYRNLYRLI